MQRERVDPEGTHGACITVPYLSLRYVAEVVR